MRYAIFSSVRGKYLLYVFFLGIVLGTLFLNFAVPDYSDEIGIFGNYFVDKFNSLQISKPDLFSFVLTSRIKEMALLLLFGLTIVNTFYNVIYCLFLGFSTGLFISSLTISYGIKGIWFYIVSIFPQYIVYIFLVVFAINKFLQINHRIYNKNGQQDNVFQIGNSKNIILNIMLIIFFVLILCIIEAWLEAYVNTSLLKKLLKSF
jgi:hypothetical protein